MFAAAAAADDDDDDDATIAEPPQRGSGLCDWCLSPSSRRPDNYAD